MTITTGAPCICPHDYIIEGHVQPRGRRQPRLAAHDDRLVPLGRSTCLPRTGQVAVDRLRRRLPGQQGLAQRPLPRPPRQRLHELSFRCQCLRKLRRPKRAGRPRRSATLRRLVVRGRRHLPARLAQRRRTGSLRPWGTFVSAQLARPPPSGPTILRRLTIKTTIANTTKTDAAVTIVSQGRGRCRGTRRRQRPRPSLCQPETNLETSQAAECPEPTVAGRSRPLISIAWSRPCSGMRRDDRHRCRHRLGIRTIRFDPDRGFFLNGKPVKIQGTCNHQDFVGVGVAVPDTLRVLARPAASEDGSERLADVAQPAHARAAGRLRRAGHARHGREPARGRLGGQPGRGGQPGSAAIATIPASSSGRCATRNGIRRGRREARRIFAHMMETVRRPRHDAAHH